MGIIGGGITGFIGAIHIRSAIMENMIDLVCGCFSSKPEVSIESGRKWFLPDNRIYSSYHEMFEKEMELVEKKYREITGQEMIKYYRPPQGKYSKENLKMAQELGYHTFFWSLAYVDWNQDAQPSHEEAFEKLLSRIHPGAIVLLHNTSSTNGEILDELLTKWEKEGYSFGTLEEVINQKVKQE